MEQDSSDNNGPAASSSSSFHNILSPSARNSQQAFHPISNSNFSSPQLPSNSRRDSQNNQQHGVSSQFFIFFIYVLTVDFS
jgi:hypothetical protein